MVIGQCHCDLTKHVWLWVVILVLHIYLDFPLSKPSFLSPHSISLSSRAHLSVIWRMGLQHRGQGTRCSGCYCHGDLYHDAGPGATHLDKVKLPWDTWQEELQHRPLQGNTEVSQTLRSGWVMEEAGQRVSDVQCVCKYVKQDPVCLAFVTRRSRPIKIWISCWCVVHEAVMLMYAETPVGATEPVCQTSE